MRISDWSSDVCSSDLFEEFEDALALATQQWKKRGRIEKIILYDSYARGDWVDEPHTAKGYRSDFDLLIIVNEDRKSVVSGKSVSVRVDLGGSRIIKKKKKQTSTHQHTNDKTTI